MWSVLPYLAYLASLYWLFDRLRLVPALLLALLVWSVTAAGAVPLWQRHRAGRTQPEAA